MWCAACRAHPQLAAQPAWIAGITNIKWFKIAKHQKCGTHAVSLALWSSGGRVRHVTHTLPMEQREALRAHFRLIYRVVKHFGMLRDVAGGVEAATLNGVNLIEAYRCHHAVAEILQHIAIDVRIGDAQPVMEAPYLAMTSDSCTDRSAKKEELMYLRFPQGNKIDTQLCFLCNDPPPLHRVHQKFCPLFLNFSASFCPCSNTKFGPQRASMVHSPSPMTPSTPGSAWANPPKTNPACRYI